MERFKLLLGMRRIIPILALFLALVLAVQVSPVFGQDEQTKKPWAGKKSDGTVITQEDLKKIIGENEKWVESKREKGNKANLSGANLIEANLTGAHLTGADLTGANLTGADLTGANLTGANLSGANLSWDDLSEASLTWANLSGANLSWANLSGADLSKADMTEANLSGADLTEANLNRADLNRADLGGANLSGADLSQTNLSEADLSKANLRWAKLNEAKLSWAKLNEADLSEADLSGTNLSGTDLSRAGLGGANLKRAKLQKAYAAFAIFEGTEIEDAEISDFFFGGARGLTEIGMSSPSAVVNLRKNAKDYGFRNEERALTAALHKHQMKYGGRAPLEKFFDDIVLGGWLTGYGAEPWNSLLLLVTLVAPFSIVYMISLKTRRKMTGIWAVRHPDRVIRSLGEDKPIKLTIGLAVGFLPYEKPRGNIGRITRWLGTLKIGLYFSILSAFSIGWRELNLGVWITRLQRQEYILRATGWVRTVSGIQSLLSVYLLALWALTYFGRPFE